MKATKTLVMISAAAVTTRDDARKPWTRPARASPEWTNSSRIAETRNIS